MRSLLVVFTRHPEPGHTKTRLIPALGANGAAELHRRMTEHTLRRAVPPDLSLEVRYAGGGEGEMHEWLGVGHLLRPQGEGDLGARMSRAFEESFDAGYGRVVIIGTDCPDLTAAGVKRALEALEENDLVLGPAADGGYYLIAIRAEVRGRATASLFRGIDWGSTRVLDQSLEAAKAAGLTLLLLETLTDIDRPEDLPVWEKWEKQGR